ncbi:MAG: metallophosphoesterase family protein [Kiritimatiellaeota bacterium]|nr:metallophosphoesterase family protein [Kiritimatiellota bacterium]
MKYAILGDIHANFEALDAVLAECERLKVDKFLCIGDIVGYNADPGRCVETVQELDVEVVIKGNHDEQASVDTELIGFNPQAAMAIEWTRNQLSEEQRLWLASLPLRKTLDARVTLVHATLDVPERWGYIFDKFTAAACMNYQFTALCFFGHTHVPLAFSKFGDVSGGRYDELKIEPGHKYLINVGSVGQPRDGDPRAAFVMYDPDDRMVRLHRVEYDIQACQEKIREAGLPERLAQRLAAGR